MKKICGFFVISQGREGVVRERVQRMRQISCVILAFALKKQAFAVFRTLLLFFPCLRPENLSNCFHGLLEYCFCKKLCKAKCECTELSSCVAVFSFYVFPVLFSA